ncbi:MAG: DUF1501 domain-containing protein [Pirellulaceae bacterium]|nr:DUF1501 domain-containing protein [Pirellulaceae bacterium]
MSESIDRTKSHPTTILDTRRQFLKSTACGIGATALQHLLAQSGNAAIRSVATDPLAVKKPHFAPKAKNVIFLFMAGAPSQLDLFTPKPEMQRFHGEPIPESFLHNLDDPVLKAGAAVFASPRKFARYGECGMDFSDYLPHLATCADDLCMVRSVVTDTANHHPGQLMMNCGQPIFGLPSMGSWVTYGLGSESDNLPGFVVMLSRNGSGDLGGSALWGNAFLPAANRGVTFRSKGDAILHLSNPRSIPDALQASRLAAVQDLNQLRFDDRGDVEIAARIASYELAARMQTSGPELIDFSQETAKTLNEYGINQEKSDWFGRNCLLARRMVERGVRFVQLYHYTWDDHAALNKRLKSNCEMTEQPAAALLKDLKQRGLLEDTLVVWGGEFGRTPMQEVRRSPAAGQEGRDHHPFGFTMCLAGGGVKPGFIYGDTDDLGYHATENRVHIHDIQATILHCLGLDHEMLTFQHQGRDFRLTDVAGNVIHDILV